MRSIWQVRSPHRAGAWIGAAATVWALAGAGCGLRQLAREDLFGTADAAPLGPADAAGDSDAPGDDAGAADRRAEDGPPTDAAGPPDGAPGDIVGGTAMLSGVVSTACSPITGLDAKVGIAGRHRCSYPQKGSFFFSDLPVGTLELAVAKEGYLLYQATVVIQPGGTVHNVALVPASPGGCADPPPPDVPCTCPDADCLPQ
jgi:hypothetical protein